MKSNSMQCYFVGQIKVRAIADRSAPHVHKSLLPVAAGDTHPVTGCCTQQAVLQ
jgi:hypothetical protein